MKANNFLKCMMTALLIGLTTIPMMAQKNIEKCIQQLEKRSDVSINSVTQRDPKTLKVVSMMKTYKLKDPSSSIIKAFEADEKDAITAIKDLPKGRMNIRNAKLTYIFQPQKNEKRIYTLSVDKNGVTTLRVVINQGKHAKMSKSDLSYYLDIKNQELKDMEYLYDVLGCKL